MRAQRDATPPPLDDTTVEAPIDYEGAARLLGVRVGTVRSWVSRGIIPHYRLGPRLVRFRIGELRAWMARRHITADAPDPAPIISIARARAPKPEPPRSVEIDPRDPNPRAA